jgi:D-cysteine desulfhydrase
MIRAGTIRRVVTWFPDPQRFPRFGLLDGPSPLTPLPRFSAALGGRADVWIKREDLLPLAFGGNKLRNLEFLVGAALAEGADTLVTSGRRWSNHARLTAAAGAKAGLAVHPRPVRAAGRPAQSGRATRRVARCDGPPGRDR